MTPALTSPAGVVRTVAFSETLLPMRKSTLARISSGCALHWEDIQGKKYPGYGCCIYCGGDGAEGGLRNQHVLPYALEGHAEIENASCQDCQQKIDPVDRHLARAVFGQYRIHAGVQTRNPKERPNSLPAQFIVGDKEISFDLPIKDHPFSLALPLWGDAGFFRSVSIDSQFPEPFTHVYHYMPPNMHETLGIAEAAKFKIWSGAALMRRYSPEALRKLLTVTWS
jgi:HNH endonuclease